MGLGMALAGCLAGPMPGAADRLQPCVGRVGLNDALCGEVTVFENRETRQGRTIALQVVVLPALSNSPRPDPLYFLAGGPGQGAATMAADVRALFGRIQATRDIVLVDQRGTGGSNGLECQSDDDTLAPLVEPDAVALSRLRACLASYDADTRFYTTVIAMDDLDEVRAYLGHDRINIYGGSYGTRAGLVYLRRHGEHVRSIVLDGLAPTDMRLPLYLARDAQRALDRLLADCAGNLACHARYPDLGNRVRALFARLEAEPVTQRVVHPRTGAAENLRIDAGLLANFVMGALYSPMTASMVPELLARAEADDFQGLLALASLGEASAENMSVGMQLSVLCAEDAPRIAAEQVASVSAGSVFARHLIEDRLAACAFWPAGTVPASYYEPVTSDVPALLLSGDLDPVTPPSWGEAVAVHLSRGRHVVAPATGHGVVTTGCGQRLLEAFVDAGSADGLDTGCVEALQRPPFFLSPAGPQP